MGREGKGQALAEMAILTPILILMFLGVFEVGWAIRSQMILDTMSREGARFATKPTHMDLTSAETADPLYEEIVEQINVSAGSQLPNDLEGVIITNLYVQAGFPCDPALREDPVGDDAWPNCDCDLAVTNPYTPAIVISPDTDAYYRYTIGSYDSRLDVSAKVQEMVDYNYRLNCTMGKAFSGYLPSDQHHMIVVELFYRHNQLLGVPPVSNFMTDPVHMRSMAAMRMVSDRTLGGW